MGKTPEEIELEIKKARYDLAAKVDALTEQVKESADVVKGEAENVKKKVDEVKKVAVKVTLVAFAAVIAVLVVKRALSRG
jgi:uncharacterized membrane protein